MAIVGFSDGSCLGGGVFARSRLGRRCRCNCLWKRVRGGKRCWAITTAPSASTSNCSNNPMFRTGSGWRRCTVWAVGSASRRGVHASVDPGRAGLGHRAHPKSGGLGSPSSVSAHCGKVRVGSSRNHCAIVAPIAGERGACPPLASGFARIQFSLRQHDAAHDRTLVARIKDVNFSIASLEGGGIAEVARRIGFQVEASGKSLRAIH